MVQHNKPGPLTIILLVAGWITCNPAFIFLMGDLCGMDRKTQTNLWIGFIIFTTIGVFYKLWLMNRELSNTK